jgi:hypothetical protein
MDKKTLLSNLSIPFDRDIFLRSLIRELAGILEDVVGYPETAGYVSLVGQNVGEWINEMYKKEISVSSLTRSQVTDVLVDLKLRIQGNFSVATQDDNKIVLENDTCPFADKVLDRPSMCMMTSNVFGVIAAENLGYAKVVIQKSIANRDDACKVILYLKPTPEAEAAEGREYFMTRKENVG